MRNIEELSTLFHTGADEGVYLTRNGLDVQGLDAILDRATSMKDRLEDVYVTGKDFQVEVWEGLGGLSVPVVQFKGTRRTLPMTGWAFSQLCDRVGMGATAYMKKCLKSAQGSLVPLNVNSWLGMNGDKEFLFRVYEGEIIAVLSEKYGVFDHAEALNCLQTALGTEDSRYSLESYSITPDNMNVRLVDPENIIMTDPLGKTDTSTAGIIFRNGQTGRSSISIEFMVYTFACTNGLIITKDRGVVYYRKHIQVDQEHFVQEVVNTLQTFPEYTRHVRADLEDARTRKVDLVSDRALMEKVKRDLSIGEDTLEKIVDVMVNDWDQTIWGLSGAITQVAQDFNAQRQYEFEKYAGTLVHWGN